MNNNIEDEINSFEKGNNDELNLPSELSSIIEGLDLPESEKRIVVS